MNKKGEVSKNDEQSMGGGGDFNPKANANIRCTDNLLQTLISTDSCLEIYLTIVSSEPVILLKIF